MVQILFFARARELAGHETVEFPCGSSLSVRSLRGRLVETYPDLKPLMATAAIAVNEEYATDTTMIQPGDTVAIIPPVSGG